MKKLGTNKLGILSALLVGFAALQGCNVTIVDHTGEPGWYWYHGGWHHHPPYYYYPVMAQENTDPTAELARDFGIRPESAKAIMNILYGSVSQDEIAKLGLNNSDLIAMANGDMPSQDGINHVAQMLNEDPAKIQSIAQSFVDAENAEANGTILLEP